MRKLFLIAATAVMAATACQKAQTPGLDSGDEVQVTISTSLPNQMPDTRAAGDGASVDRCIMQIYLDGQPYGEHQYAQVEGLKASFSTRLVAGETYDLVFWADRSGADINTDLHYNTADFAHVSFIGDYSGNDETRDAFFGSTQIVADKSQAVDVNLQRPFGQLNVKTLDLAEVKASAPALEPKKVKIAFKSVPTEINLITGELNSSSTVAVEYSEAAGLSGTDGELSVDYVFAPKTEGEQYLADFTMSFFDDSGAETISAYEFTNIPVQRNYRTIVSGNLLTRKTDINVEVLPEFEKEDIEITDINSSDELTSVFSNGGSAKLTGDVSVPESHITVSEEVNIDLNGYTLTLKGEPAINTVDGTITFSNGTVEANDYSDATMTIFVAGDNGKIELDGVTVKTNGTTIGPSQGAKNSTVIVRNSKIESGAYAVATNALYDVENVTITLENSTFVGNTPICVNIPCTLTIDGCNIQGDTQGMMLRGGTADIRNSTITLSTDGLSSEEEAKEFADFFLNANWGSGNMVNIAALTVGNKGGKSYQYPTVLNLENTTLRTTGTYASYFPAMYVHANAGENIGVTINYDADCIFDGDVVYGSENIVVNGEAQ